jgi:hypothetical protein
VLLTGVWFSFVFSNSRRVCVVDFLCTLLWSFVIILLFNFLRSPFTFLLGIRGLLKSFVIILLFNFLSTEIMFQFNVFTANSSLESVFAKAFPVLTIEPSRR